MGILAHWVEILHAEVEALYEKCQYSGFFWFVLSRIWIEYGEIRSISPYSLQMQENTDQKKNSK